MASRMHDVVPVDEGECDAWEAGRLLGPADLGAGLWSIPTAIPEGTLPGTLGYALVGDDGVHGDDFVADPEEFCIHDGYVI